MSKTPTRIDLTPKETGAPRNQEVVRLRTSYWSDKSGLHIKKSITTLHRKSTGVLLLYEDLGNIGAQEVAERITNLDECEDGLYVFEICNEHKDWETGVLDDYDYKLLPVQEGGKKRVERLELPPVPKIGKSSSTAAAQKKSIIPSSLEAWMDENDRDIIYLCPEW